MFVAHLGDNTRVIAWQTARSAGPFFCPECSARLILKRGPIVAAHFAHWPHTACHFSAGESRLHMRVKRELYEALTVYPGCTSVELERQLPGVRPDVSLQVDGVQVAIEIQRSTLSIDEIQQRISRYTALDVHVLWLLPYPLPQPGAGYQPCSWEMYLHALYCGRLYFHHFDAYVYPVRLRPHLCYNLCTSRFLEAQADELALGDLPRARAVNGILYDGQVLHLVEDFVARDRPRMLLRFGRVAPCKLWLDTAGLQWVGRTPNTEEFRTSYAFYLHRGPAPWPVFAAARCLPRGAHRRARLYARTHACPVLVFRWGGRSWLWEDEVYPPHPPLGDNGAGSHDDHRPLSPHI